MLYKKLTHTIIGCSMNVHNFLGNGFREVIYQRCLEIEFKKKNIIYSREKSMDIFYDGIQKIV